MLASKRAQEMIDTANKIGWDVRKGQSQDWYTRLEDFINGKEPYLVIDKIDAYDLKKLLAYLKVD